MSKNIFLWFLSVLWSMLATATMIAVVSTICGGVEKPSLIKLSLPEPLTDGAAWSTWLGKAWAWVVAVIVLMALRAYIERDVYGTKPPREYKSTLHRLLWAFLIVLGLVALDLALFIPLSMFMKGANNIPIVEVILPPDSLGWWDWAVAIYEQNKIWWYLFGGAYLVRVVLRTLFSKIQEERAEASAAGATGS